MEIFELKEDQFTRTFELRINVPGQKPQVVYCIDRAEVNSHVRNVVCKIEEYLKDVRISANKVLFKNSMSSKDLMWISEFKQKIDSQQKEHEKTFPKVKYRAMDVDNAVLGEFETRALAIECFKIQRPQFHEKYIHEFIEEIKC